jgi:tRNA nucleotidyltransferase (CCA-adding enzyme)
MNLPARQPVPEGVKSGSDLTPLVDRLLSRGDRSLLREIGRFAESRGWKVYSVGGSVRDLLLGSGENFDLDILVEEHGLEFARLFARSIGGSCKLYRRFATAMVITRRGRRIDVTTTRGEVYPAPGSLPEIVPGSLEEDIHRRDFTINALAFSLNPGSFGRLIDLTGGVADLEAGIIRVLHRQSFRDDPTRIFRAVRFRQRLGFTIEPRTEELIRTAVDLRLFEEVSPERLRHELELIFREPDPPGAVEAMAGYDQLRFIHPRLRLGEAGRAYLDRLAAQLSWFQETFPRETVSPWRVCFGALVYRLDPADLKETAEKFNLSKRFFEQLRSARKDEAAVAEMLSAAEEPLPSRLSALLRGRGPEVWLIMLARCGAPEAVSRFRRYLTRYRFVSGEVTGRDLECLGLPPSPVYRPILEELLSARLDGRISSREEELDLARRLIDKSPRR